MAPSFEVVAQERKDAANDLGTDCPAGLPSPHRDSQLYETFTL